MKNIIEYGAVVVTTADGVAAMTADPTSVNVLSSTGQIISAAVSRSPAGTIAVTPVAALVTGLKIVSDVQSGRPRSPGDILNANQRCKGTPTRA